MQTVSWSVYGINFNGKVKLLSKRSRKGSFVAVLIDLILALQRIVVSF